MTASRSSEPLSSRRPGLNGALCIVIGVVLLAMGVAAFVGAGYDHALVGTGLVAVLLAMIAFLLGGFGFSVGRSASPRSATGPVLLLTILAAAIGFVGNGITAVLSALEPSVFGIAASFLLFILALSLALQGAMIHGAAKTR